MRKGGYIMEDVKLSNKTLWLESLYMKYLYSEMVENDKDKYECKFRLNTGDNVNIKVNIEKERK